MYTKFYSQWSLFIILSFFTCYFVLLNNKKTLEHCFFLFTVHYSEKVERIQNHQPQLSKCLFAQLCLSQHSLSNPACEAEMFQPLWSSPQLTTPCWPSQPNFPISATLDLLYWKQINTQLFLMSFALSWKSIALAFGWKHKLHNW